MNYVELRQAAIKYFQKLDEYKVAASRGLSRDTYAAFRAMRADQLRAVLCPEHKTFAAAGSQRGYWTPYQATCRNVLEYRCPPRRGPAAQAVAY